MKLKPRQIHAIRLLAVGTPIVKVAETLDVSEMTLWRWGKQPDFQERLNSIANSGLAEIARTINTASLAAAETLNEILCDLSLPTQTRMKAALGVLHTMSSVNAAIERGLQHRVADFDPTHRFSGQSYSYQSDGFSNEMVSHRDAESVVTI